MATGPAETPDIRSEARGPHWVAWVAQADGRPRGSIVVVGQTRDEAEARARRWAEKSREWAIMTDA